MYEDRQNHSNSLLRHSGGLLRFLHGSAEPLKILTVECHDYLPELRHLYPTAELFSVTADDDAPHKSEYADLAVEWHVLDYLSEPLTFEEKYFDYILADRCLELAANPQDIAAGFGTFIKETGFLLTSFENIRFWKTLQQLMNGHYYAVVRRLYARPEFERLLYASFYKDTVFAPERRYGPEDLLTKLKECGFDNEQHDMDTEFWFVKAARSTPEIATLKSLYTVAERRLLVTLLRRIEYGLAVEANAREFWRLYDKMELFPDYVAAFIHETIIHRRRFYKTLIATSPEERPRIRNILSAAANVIMNEEDEAALVKLLRELQYGCQPTVFMKNSLVCC